jgi:hypothetical protein
MKLLISVDARVWRMTMLIVDDVGYAIIGLWRTDFGCAQPAYPHETTARADAAR